MFRINVESSETGADDPVSGGGTGATAATYFDATFGGNGLRRLLICDATTALTTACAQVPEFSVAPGGRQIRPCTAGAAAPSAPTRWRTGATEVAIHEIGHTAFGLADEYAYYAAVTRPGTNTIPR